ncbi:hypothetical protein DVH24_032403 [Malus domestica]|uniref:RNase H type-1 domain-containing protein n=1 Tax=Malus domestica TaxID=3750 RepID=A0A498J4B5_MALDO|nr:hypothetical protein DVH24_032403 [Malus domestica]
MKVTSSIENGLGFSFLKHSQQKWSSFSGVYGRESFLGCGGVFQGKWISRGFQYSFFEFGCLSSPFLGAPPIGVIKANFDGAWSSNTLQSGLGVVFRSSNGSIINGVSTPCLSSSALQTEAKAALLAVRSAKDSNFSDVVFESDSLELNRSLKMISRKPIGPFFPCSSKFETYLLSFARSTGGGFLVKRIVQPIGLHRIVKEGCVLMFRSYDPHPL